MRKFLYTIVILIVLVAAALFALRLYGDDLTELAFVPSGDFVEQDPLAANAYQNPDMWFSRPGMGAPNDPARWQPAEAQTPASPASASPTPRITPEAVLEGSDASPSPSPSPASSPVSEIVEPVAEAAAEGQTFAVFFVHPTSFYDNRAWNAALDDADSQATARLLVRGLASAFNRASEIWVPRYRQATFGAFLSDSQEAEQAIDAAYRDVAQAFAFFVESVDDDVPIVLAGHSQGAFHVLRLLREEVLGTPLEQRLAMVYPIGWPISVEHDLPELGLPACATPRQGGCIMSWASFAEPADPGMMLNHYANSPGFDGQERGDSPILCVNPLTGTLNGSAPASRNLGTLVPDEDLTSGELVPGAVPARCDEDGLLLIGDPPEMGNFVLPFNNYHVYDIPLFWRNLQQDVTRRVSAWQQRR